MERAGPKSTISGVSGVRQVLRARQLIIYAAKNSQTTRRYPTMKRDSPDLEKISNVTLEHYNQHAEDFWQGTKDHDVNQNIEALLKYIKGNAPFTILDFGCGPGRDLKTF
jgi:2-polyprenyl-3-methyl-5-hydroxy-6-metoxy-1,4-benzoquinol methylase